MCRPGSELPRRLLSASYRDDELPALFGTLGLRRLREARMPAAMKPMPEVLRFQAAPMPLAQGYHSISLPSIRLPITPSL